MIDEQWRILLYPLGFLSALAFGSRFLVQWAQSEWQGRSVVTPLFWQISLLGNLLLVAHSVLQLQIHICLIQGWNAVIAWRNLNLLQNKRPPASFATVVGIMAGSTFLILLIFALHGNISWFRIPIAPWQSSPVEQVSFLWHLVGFFGTALFSLRFWVQWWEAERAHKSQLTTTFWWLSIIGALIALAYAVRIQDSVNLIGPLLGLVPYVRNLMLIKKAPQRL